MSHMNIARDVVLNQKQALEILSVNIPKDFSSIVDYLLKIKGRVILVGIGKSGYIAKKISASFASTGTPSFFIHPSEASHGDLGMITDKDLVIMISNSGETQELFDTINYCKRYNIKIGAITMNKNSTLAVNSDFLLNLPVQKEFSHIAAPTTSALMTLSLGDALVTSVHEARGFSVEDFRLFHPGGKIGANLLKVSDLMKIGDQIPIVKIKETFSNVILVITKKCIGCAVVVSEDLSVKGIITDGDLRRHINDPLDKINAELVMTHNPKIITSNILATEALNIMNSNNITSLIVQDDNKLSGIIHIHDILRAGVS